MKILIDADGFDLVAVTAYATERDRLAAAA